MISFSLIITLTVVLFTAAGRHSTPRRDRTPITSWAWSDIYYNCLQGLDLFAPTVYYPSRTKATDSRIHH